MSRFPTQQPQPAQPTLEGDTHFSGLQMKLDRSQLSPGQYADGLNIRCATGEVRKRGGSILPAFANVVAFGAIVGSGIYSNPRGSRQLLLATIAGKVYTVTANGYPSEIAIPDGETLVAPVYFEQAFDKVLMLRGTDHSPLEWDGTATGSFALVTKKNPADASTDLIPNIERGIAFQSRFLFVIDRTDVGLSDILDYTSYDPILDNFPANLGSSDAIVRLYPYASAGVIIGKENRLELLANFTDPANPQNASLQVLSDTVGTCSWGSWAMVGGDAFFLSANPPGIYRVTQVLQDRIQTSPVPVSDPIEPLIRRINWPAAGGAVAAVHGFYYVIAVPLDGSTVNDTLLWFNTVTNAWEGYDQFDAAAGMQIDNLLQFDYNGERRLYAINYATGTVHLLEEGKWDVTSAGTFEISSRLETRGYSTLGWNGATVRDVRRVEIGVRTWAPSVTVTELTDQTDDERPLTATPYTRDRRKWNIFGKAPYDGTQPHGAAGRQDYSVPLPSDTNAIFSLDGVNPERQQADVLRFATRTRCHFASLRIEASEGDCDVTGVLMESAGVSKGTTRRAA